MLRDVKSIKIDKDRDFKQKLLLCLYWTNRKAIRTEGCAPFLIKKIVTSDATYVSEPGKFLRLSNDIFKNIETNMEVGNIVEKLKEEIKREKPSICSSFPQRIGIDI